MRTWMAMSGWLVADAANLTDIRASTVRFITAAGAIADAANTRRFADTIIRDAPLLHGTRPRVTDHYYTALAHE